jgi:hypothetical protein
MVIINQCESADCASSEEIAKLSTAGVRNGTRYISSIGHLQFAFITDAPRLIQASGHPGAWLK